MKQIRKVFVIIITFSITISFVSCKKCETCVLKESDGTIIWTSGEKCGKNDIDLAYNTCKYVAIQYNLYGGGVAKCPCVCTCTPSR